MKRVSAPERTRERLRALMDGRLGTAPDRSNLVLLAAQLIVGARSRGSGRKFPYDETGNLFRPNRERGCVEQAFAEAHS
jgi:hypothetical protein